MDSKKLQAKDKKELQTKSETTQTRPVFVPAVDIYENNDALVLLADMPGVSNQGVEIHLEDNELTIRGRVQEDPSDRTPIYTEYRSGDYYRSFTLSSVIDQERIEASMRNGVLKVILPKAEAAKPRRIEVKAG
ncbi:MAG: Hsp20/alpha crystallin family protein [Deltaproteobacteria bacterium]|nr:Hsp20/alpha crystallin family protein [Deltaproteobacteria bacterium]MBW1929559.1 Hsp20/alpha crystallin family protein [Deltaproteobacteria bacterium]MBW2026605.1 Hsp20/alpha crystallin family protein [Deltaproteobacteria bacterium]MBW2127046.1 Hsp20/alpha crystallin family protein [Deltaproteobacteria bacterium]RLB15053.1 MAG: Hsp20/alpha crystallin family protein [Deltaproteobacteria bacterium]